MSIKFEVTLELLEEMAQCIHDCSWVSSEEIATYMKGCVTDSDDYEPEEWSVDGKGQIAIDRDSLQGEAKEVQAINNKLGEE
tara:strand:+ start:84 stop:329 length:246 start_codon:yes stop_codon:yes gene_type:complete